MEKRLALRRRGKARCTARFWAFVALVGGLMGLGGFYFVPIPEGNREPLLLALGLVLGWGSTIVGYEFGSSPSARKAAEAGVRHNPEI